MKEPIEIKMITASGALRRKIEEAGELQAEQTAAQNKYKKCRAELDGMLKKEVVDDVPAFADNYWAIRSHDKYDEIDPIALLKRVTHTADRRKVLTVPVTTARKELEPDDLEFLIKNKTAKETTLHVNKITKEDK